VINRRQILIATGAAIGEISFRNTQTAMAKELGHVSEIGFKVPDHAVDTHCHVFDPVRFPYWTGRRYTPPPATVTDLRRFHSAIHVRHTVCVQPSVYGTDNACLLDALQQLGPYARGVAVIDKDFSAQQLDDLIGAGVVGTRINLEVSKDRDINKAIARLEDTVATLRGRELIIQMYGPLPMIAALAARIQAQPHRVVIDHFGLAKAAEGPEQAGMSALIGLMASEKVFVKLSGPYQISALKPTYTDSIAIGKTLIDAAPDQVIWGSDWPHAVGSERRPDAKPTDLEAFRDEDEGRNFSLVRHWATSVQNRQKLLVSNASKLFGFPQSNSAVS